ncbi:MAG: hypothetical protein K2W86_12865 [Sphingomonas sp.]|uniref:hypothetical protein n=1 Tax=Sphingomonas sp. TaxID=28214 RepID=UPI0035A95989|nr:hypothetical protein [Sphingomonas sp.]
MKGLTGTRVIFGSCAVMFCAAAIAPLMLRLMGIDFLPLKWPILIYGGLALVGMLVSSPLWIAAELNHKFQYKNRNRTKEGAQHNG